MIARCYAALAGYVLFMVRILERCFKNILTMIVVVGSAMMAGGYATYGDNMQFSVRF